MMDTPRVIDHSSVWYCSDPGGIVHKSDTPPYYSNRTGPSATYTCRTVLQSLETISSALKSA